MVLHRFLADDGYEVPTIEPQYADCSAVELLDELAEVDDISRCMAESAAWRVRRDPDAAAKELVAAAGQEGDSARAQLAFQILRDLGSTVAAPHVAPLEDSDVPHL